MNKNTATLQRLGNRATDAKQAAKRPFTLRDLHRAMQPHKIPGMWHAIVKTKSGWLQVSIVAGWGGYSIPREGPFKILRDNLNILNIPHSPKHIYTHFELMITDSEKKTAPTKALMQASGADKILGKQSPKDPYPCVPVEDILRLINEC